MNTCLLAHLAQSLPGDPPVTMITATGSVLAVILVLVAGAVGAGLAHWFHKTRLLRDLYEDRQQVELSRRRLRDLERIIPELIIEVNKKGEIQFLNESALNLLSLTPDSKYPDTVDLLIAPRDRAGFADFFAEALSGEMPASRRLHLLVHDGDLLPVRAIAAPILSIGDGNVMGMRAVFTDIRGELQYSQALDQHRLVAVTLTEVLKALTMAGADEWSHALDGALTSLRRLVALDRCSLLRVNCDDGDVGWEYQWAGSDVLEVDPGEHFARLLDLPWVAERIMAGDVVHVENLDDLPSGAELERERWARLGVCSLLAIPMFSEGKVMGLMAFDTVSAPAEWGAEDVRLLETLTGMIASTWHQRLARREQRAATQQFEDIIEFLPDATFVIDSKGRIVAWNKAMAQLTGKPRDEMLGQGDRAYAIPFHGERVPLLVDHFSDVDLNDYARHYQFIEMVGENLYGETFVPFMNGGRGAYLWCTASPLYDAEGKVVGAIESLRDVTYRKASELALREGEERYRRLVETLNDGMGIINAEGRIVFVNDRLCEMTGFARDELVEQHVGQFLPASNLDLDPLDWSGWELEPGDALELDIPCRDGSLLPVRVSPSPLHSEEGEFQGGFAVVTDMTSIRAAESRYMQLNENLEKKVVESTRDLLLANDALRNSEGRYRRIIEGLSEGYIFYSLDVSGEFTYISPSYRDILGYANLEDIVERFAFWYDQSYNWAARLAAEKTLLGFKQAPYELRVEHANGDEQILEVLEAPLFDQIGTLTSIEGIMHDVTDERHNQRLVREAQAKLVESEKLAALGGLMAGLSHEINTPIGIGVTASSHLEQLNADCVKAYQAGKLTQSNFESFLERTGESAHLIQSNLNRAAELMQNFKQVAVDQSAGQERTFNLSQYFDDVIRSLSPRLRNTAFKIICHCPDDLEMHCDPGALYQILSNLVINSLNHGFDGLLVGEINISALLDGDQIVLEYRDNGNGMSREQIARIYEPFYTTRRGRGGTGLGMHIVYNNVTQTLGGRIVCASKPGRGARFTISVPLPAEVEHG